MVSRCIAILISAWFPTLAVILPLGPTHTTHAVVAGILATVLSFGSLSDNRLRIPTAVVGAWVALSPFVISSTLLEKVLAVSWGMTMFVCMIGPFSAEPLTIRRRAAETEVPPAGSEREFGEAAQ